MERFAGKQVIINAVEDWGTMKYSLCVEGRAPMVTTDKVKWEAAVAQVRAAGAIIVDNAAIKAERDAAIAAMQAQIGKK